LRASAWGSLVIAWTSPPAARIASTTPDFA
jgi:hypothetical protein